jgi:hypothetical protein
VSTNKTTQTAKVAVLCWEESRPWVSALRQQGFSVPWVEEPRGEGLRPVTAVEPDLLLVDLTRLPEQASGMVADLADKGALDGIPVVLVSAEEAIPPLLAGKVSRVSVTRPEEIIQAVKAALQGR